MQPDKKPKWEDLEKSKTLTNCYAGAYPDFISGMAIAKIFKNKNVGMYTKNFQEYEGILFERHQKKPSWKNDRYRSLSQPLINIIKRDTKITRTTDIKNLIDSKNYRIIIGATQVIKTKNGEYHHRILRTHKDILGILGLNAISEYFKSEIRKYKHVKNIDTEKVSANIRNLDPTFIPDIKIGSYGVEDKRVLQSNKFFRKFNIDTFKELTKLYSEHKAILTGVKYAVLYSDSITK